MKLINVFHKIKSVLGIKQSHQKYWDQRAEKLGERAVVNLKYDSALDKITEYQEEQIFPILGKYLNGNERKLLDFGCGSGRFMSSLEKFTGAKVIGVDSTEGLIIIAKKNHPYSNFIIAKNNKLLLDDGSIDIVWICLVMGGIPEDRIRTVINEINRVLSTDGLVILIENTSLLRNSNYWSYRSPEDYIKLFEVFNLKVEGRYKEVDEDITIMAGRKKVT